MHDDRVALEKRLAHIVLLLAPSNSPQRSKEIGLLPSPI